MENIFKLSFHVTDDKKKFGMKPNIELSNNNYEFNDKHRQLTLYKKYSRRDVCRLFNWQKDDSSTIYGYRTKHGTCPIFVTYHKKDAVDSSVDYGDEFLSPALFRWFTRSKLTFYSNEVKTILAAKDSGLEIHVFTKKGDGEGYGFYYMGTTTVAEK